MAQCSPEKITIAKQAFDQALSKMASLGAVIVDPADVKVERMLNGGYDAVQVLYANEFKEGIAKYPEQIASTEMGTLQDIIE